MRDEIPIAHRLVLSLLALTLLAGVAALGLEVAIGAYDDVYELKAVFPRSGQGLDTTSSVKIRGVTVGTVSAIALRPDGRAEVTLHIDAQHRVADTVLASAEPLSVFGPKFVRLDQGEHEATGPYLPDGASIAKTAAPTEIAAVLGDAARVLDALDPAELHTIIATLAQGLDGLGPNLAKGVDDLAQVVDIVHRHRDDTRQLLTDLSTVTKALADRGSSITSTAAALHQVLPTITAHGDQLGALLDATSSVARTLSGVVDAHAPALDLLIGGLLPTVQVLYDQLACVPGFLDANAQLVGALGDRLLSYVLPDGHIAGVVSGPASFDRLLGPAPQPTVPPVAPCGSAG